MSTSKEKRIIKHEGSLKLADGAKEIPCFVLEDGTRVLSGRAMQEALSIRDRKEGEKRGGYILPTFFDSKALKPFIDNKLEVANLDPIICYRGNQVVHGYEATVLVDLCDAMLEARRAGVKLTERQEIVTNQCEVLIRSFAKVGIIALVDEATGYQNEREKDELQKILRAYVSQELLPWQKRFPDIFYKELFRLNGWDYTVKGIKKRPGVIGTWTNKLVYDQLPPGVLDELKKKTPKSDAGNYTARFFQSLTPDTGNPHLTAQIQQITTLFRLSDNMKHMWQQFNRLKEAEIAETAGQQLKLPFQFDEKGHTIEPPQDEPKQSPLSEFNKKLDQALKYDPKKNKPDEEKQ